jgi:hypothetical protein
MGNISDKTKYPQDSNVSNDDFLIGSDKESKVSKTFTIGSITGYKTPLTRAQVQTLIAQEGLVPGATYIISDAGTPPTTIEAKASDTNALFKICYNLANTQVFYVYNINTNALNPYSGDGDGDMLKSVYDPEGIEEQLAGLTAEQELLNKNITDSSNTVHAVAQKFLAKANVTIPKGALVYISAYSSDNEVPVVSAFSGTQRIVGIAAEEIEDEQIGEIFTKGVLKDVNTNAFNVGDILYASSTGTLTATQDETILKFPIAVVVKKHAAEGQLLILPINVLQRAQDVAFTDPMGDITEDNVFDALMALYDEVDNKQDSLGFTPENAANKENATLDTSVTKYPTNNLVKEYIDSGLIGKANASHSHIISDVTNLSDSLAAKVDKVNTPIEISETSLDLNASTHSSKTIAFVNAAGCTITANDDLPDGFSCFIYKKVSGGTIGFTGSLDFYDSPTPSLTAIGAFAYIYVYDNKAIFVNLSKKRPEPIEIYEEAGTSYTIAQRDVQSLLRMTSGSAISVMLPNNSTVAIAVGEVVTIEQSGAGTVTVTADSGVTLNAFNGAKTAGQFAAVQVVKTATNVWSLYGGVA